MLEDKKGTNKQRKDLENMRPIGFENFLGLENMGKARDVDTGKLGLVPRFDT
jgi:hypothetical protein